MKRFLLIILLLIVKISTAIPPQNKLQRNAQTLRALITGVSNPVYSHNIFGLATSGFGYRVHPVSGVKHHHNGLDIAVKYAPVLSVLFGRVEKTGYDARSGNYVVIKHLDNVTTSYAHLSEIRCVKGQVVRAGQIIAISGNTGSSTGPHLHFVLKINGKAINPLLFLKYINKRRN